MKMRKYLLTGMILLAILVAVPLVETCIFHRTLRLVPGAQPQPEAAAGQEQASDDGISMTITAYEGYDPDDRWTEQQCSFSVNAPAAGTIVLHIYYPFEVTGEQTGHIYLDGDWCLDYVVPDGSFALRIPCEAGQHQIQAISDYACQPENGDSRTLAFVLTDVVFQAE